MAFTFVRTKIRFAKSEKRKEAIQKTKEWMMKQPNVIFASEGQGMDGAASVFHFTRVIQTSQNSSGNMTVSFQTT